ncbi:hypothetical protein A4E84_16715 [Streptomyces qaidamensis]|uniref:DUF1648 domain-containing protein n=1 Tax=Streptomyces qaidamensis TaxID=1783515 RepID=A0A143C0P9_9ACTN|nr:hypothetical protein [Streptomyces qaidamensis]AMW11008.1 hypothetical protein A4E84_16715 [Streptomyces qaidamensis]
MAHLVPVALAAVLAGGVDLFPVRAAWLHWTGSDRAPDIMYGYSWNPSAVRGHERGIVTLAASAVCLKAGVATAAAAEGVAGIAPVHVGAIFILGSLPWTALHLTIAWFNWPKALVPPHRRGESGSVTEWWRQRAARDKGRGPDGR